MGATLHVGKWGGSLAVRLPKAIVEQCGISEGAAMEMAVQEGWIVMRRRACDLDDMLDRITDDNLHPEQDFGAPQGGESW